MVLVPGQTYRRGNEYNPGNDKMYREEAPPHMVTVSGFWIDKYEVTNAQFKEFVDATGYVTFAEKSLSKEEFPRKPPEQMVPGATIFSPLPMILIPGPRMTPGDGGPTQPVPVGKVLRARAQA